MYIFNIVTYALLKYQTFSDMYILLKYQTLLRPFGYDEEVRRMDRPIV